MHVQSFLAALLKKLNIPFDYGPTKIRQGYGEAVQYVLQSLVEVAMNNVKFVYQKPVHKMEE